VPVSDGPRFPSTKLVCTLGPATSTPEAVRALAGAGTAVFRVNFSHGTRDDHAQRVALIRAAERDLGTSLAVLVDLPGPKVRLGQLAMEPLELVEGQRFLLRTDDAPGDRHGAPVSYAGLGGDVEPGDRILLADGAVELVVRESGGAVVTECVRGGEVSSRQGVNAPSERLGLPAITDLDREGLERALELGADLVAQSFVRSASDVENLRLLMGDRPLPLVAKIETRVAVEQADAIMEAADAVMVARGDLGVELPMEEIPVIQKDLLRRARTTGVPSIVATQMLESMIESSRPTRAEATDVANAVLDGADAVMLSGETAVGAYPLEAARTALRIADVAERRGGRFRDEPPACRHEDGPSAIAHAAAQLAAQHPDAVAIACFTGGGTTPRLLSAERPSVPIYAFAPNDTVRRGLALRWGVRPVAASFPENTDATIADMERRLVALGASRGGSVVGRAAASPVGQATRPNLLKLHRVASTQPAGRSA
jgi:pyruvate kinase